MPEDLLYLLSLTLVPNIGEVNASELLSHYGSAKSIFTARRSELDKLPGIGTVRSQSIKTFKDFAKAEAELKFIEKYKITVLTRQDERYPRKLLGCYDAPVVLYYKGSANLNASRILSVIGTRNNTEYGREMTNRLIEELENEQVLIVSGLAYGIDTFAHKTALKKGNPTIGVLAHGLDRIYPASNKSLAKEMLGNGGLLTDFMSGCKPDKQNFPKRNRIVAGIADATIVIETDINGGSMITAELANSYNRDVFAFPGKAIDVKSSGCNYLIRSNKAALITSAKDVLEFMNWTPPSTRKAALQKKLFADLSPNENYIVTMIKEKQPIHIDEINHNCNISSSAIAAAILNLELQGIVISMPGKMYKLS
ncbi:MAG: DNA-processing protein DprA [Chitinophagaceae bacterium]|nr:DNA-processing protein DprA [Chitinophagaceae bacterium]